MNQQNKVDLPAVVPQATGMVAVAQSRAAQEVQGAIVMAKQFPRNTIDAHHRIIQACKRTTLAEQAIYSYPRGGKKVEGPTIRMAEVLAQNWGNMQTGVIEVSQTPTESVMMAYAWDLETNWREERTFTVPHIRYTRDGGAKPLGDDPRDIYEVCANMGSRRKRACILALIPGDVVDSALDQINETLRGDSSEPFEDRLRIMVEKFASIQVTIQMIEKRLNHVIGSTTENELVDLRKIYSSIRDQMSGVNDWFFDVDENGEVKPRNGGAADLADKLTNGDHDPPKPKAQKKSGKKASKAKANDQKPEPDLTHFNTVVQAMCDFIEGCEQDAAEARITKFCNGVFGVLPGDITDEQCTNMIQKISAGELEL